MPGGGRGSGGLTGPDTPARSSRGFPHAGRSDLANAKLNSTFTFGHFQEPKGEKKTPDAKGPKWWAPDAKPTLKQAADKDVEKFWKTSGEELKESYKWASDIRAYSRSASVDLAADTKGMPLPKTLYSGTYHGHTGSAAKGKDGSYRYGRSESNKAYQMSALQAQKNKQIGQQSSVSLGFY